MYQQHFGFNLAVGPTGAGREYAFCSDAVNMQGGRDIWVATAAPELLYSRRTGPVAATQGYVYILVAASDSVSGLDGPPVVSVTDAAGQQLPTSSAGGSLGVYWYRVEITSSVSGGRCTVVATTHDLAGHAATDTDYFDVNKNRITGTVSFVTMSPSNYWLSRDVTFKATTAGGPC